MESTARRKVSLLLALAMVLTAFAACLMPFTAHAAAAAPEGLAVAEIDGGIQITWKHGAAIGYYIYRSDSADGEYKQLAATTNKGTYTDKTAKAGQAYYYKIASLSLNGIMLQLSEKSQAAGTAAEAVQKSEQALPVAEGLEAIAQGSDSAYLLWPEYDGADGYAIERAASTDEESTLLNIVADTIYQDTGLAAGTTYYYIVYAMAGEEPIAVYTAQTITTDAAGTDPGTSPEPSEPVTSPEPEGALPAPMDITATYQADARRVRISWGAVNGAVEYGIGRTDGTADMELIDSTDATEYFDTNIVEGTAYQYSIIAVDSAGNMSPASAIASVTVPGTIAPTPAPTTEPQPTMTETPIATATPAPPVSGGTITTAPYAKSGYVGVDLTWAAVIGAKKYTVYHSLNGTDWQKLGTTRHFDWNDKRLKGNTTYYYKILADNGAELYGQGVTPQQQMEAKVCAYIGFGSVGTTVKWTDLEGVSSYTVARSTDGITYTDIATTKSCHYTDKDLAANTKYYYRITADNGQQAIAEGSTRQQVLMPAAYPNGFGANSSITVRWNKISDATSYDVYRSTYPGGGYELVDSTTELSWQDDDVTRYRMHYYKIEADNGSVGYAFSMAF